MKEFLLTLLQSLIIAAVPVVATYLCRFLNAKSAQVQQYIRSEEAKELLKEAVEAVTTAVIGTNQTYVDALKASGEFTVDNQKEAFKKSYETAVAIMTTEAKDFIAKAYGSLDEWLAAQIEAAVKVNK